MSDYTINIDLPPHKLGDEWPGVSIGPVMINSMQPQFALTRLRWHFRNGVEVYRMDSSSGDREASISIVDAEHWVAEVPAIANFLPFAGRWAWDCEFYRAGHSAPLTLYKGTLTVVPDVTQ